MLAFLFRRILLTIPTILGVLLLTFVLFSLVAKNPARAQLGPKASVEAVRAMEARMGLNKPRFFNVDAYSKSGFSGLFDSQFFDLATFNFPQSVRYERSIAQLIHEKAPVSLAIQLPAFLIGIGLQLAIALFVASRRNSAFDLSVTFLCVASLAVPSLTLYIAFQWLFGAQLRWFPVAGWDSGLYAVSYAALPILCSVLLSLGGGIRFYRTVILEEVGQDYIRTALAKGVRLPEIYLTHVLRNVMIPVVTSTITALPFLIFGAIILERLFQIPGLGGLLVDSIFRQDRSVVMALTYLTALMYTFAMLLSDILYTWADPRVSLP